MSLVPRPVRTAAAVTGLVVLAGCGGKAGAAASSAGGAVRVTAGDSSCVVSTGSVPAGRRTFAVTNKGSDVTEAYVYAAGDRVMGEVENIGPGLERDLTVDLPPGTYQLACKPGMVGDGIRQPLVVTGAAASSTPTTTPQLAAAVAGYRRYVETEAAALVTSTAPFVAAVRAGDVAKAKRLYAAPRTHYERIEPIAESFGDLDPLIDMRADDVTAGEQFVGFHRLERDLWQRGDVSGDGAVAGRLLTDVTTLRGLIPSVSITPLTMANGAKSLLDEVAKSKVTGEEERYSHLDLTDFAANVEGSRQAFTELRPAIASANAALVSTLEHRFASIAGALGRYAAAPAKAAATGAPYAPYTTLSAAQVKALAVEVDALSEPLGQLAAALPQS